MKYAFRSVVVCMAMTLTQLSLANANQVSLDTWSSVVSAIEEANESGWGVVNLATKANLTVDKPLPPITGKVFLEGNGAVVESGDAYHGALIRIEQNSFLEIRNLTITGFDREQISQSTEFRGLLDNRGNLKLTNVTISENPICPYNCFDSLPILNNSGEALVQNTTFYENKTAGIENIVNCGMMSFINSTLVENYAGKRWGLTTVLSPVPGAISSCENSETEFGNTLIQDSFGTCGAMGSVSDLGGNFDSGGSCGLDPALSVLNKHGGLGNFGLHGGLVPTVGLEPDSSAIDIGVNEICSSSDARTASRPVRGLLGNDVNCDAGAFEYGGAFGNADLAVNGMNGLWFSKAADGHYVHVLRVSPDRVYVNWTAFDDTADQMWIFAVADSAGEQQFAATAYINEGGQLVPGGAPEGSVVSEWGSVELEFLSCTVGTFRYESLDSSIGSGEFQIDRLAFVEGVGCLQE